MTHLRRDRAGFTLIELLVVISIIGVLAVLLLPAIRRVRQKTKEGAVAAQINALRTALQLFQTDWDGDLPNPTLLDSSGDLVPLYVNADFLALAYRTSPESSELDASNPNWVKVRDIYDEATGWLDYGGGNCPATEVLQDDELDVSELLYLLVAVQFLAVDDSDPPERVPAFFYDANGDGGLDPGETVLYPPRANASPYQDLKASQVANLDEDLDDYYEILDAFGNPILYSVGWRTARSAEVFSMGADGIVDFIDENGNGTWDPGEPGNNGVDDDDDGLKDEAEDEINQIPELVDDIVSW